MATTITPAVGITPAFLQGGDGAAVGYSGLDVRRMLWMRPVQEGVIDSGSFEVVQRAAGANMSVDINASTGNGALVQGDSITSQGLYYVAPATAVINETITAADATNPRIDQVILEVKDDTHDSGGLNIVRTRVVDGTATSGATLDNRTGAASLPSSAIRLADVLVPAADTTIANNQIRSRKPWAMGAHNVVSISVNGFFTTSTTYGWIEVITEPGLSTEPRLEYSGVPVRLTLTANFENVAAGGDMHIAIFVDGTIVNGATTSGYRTATGRQTIVAGTLQIFYTPSAGSHKITPYIKTTNSGDMVTIHALSDEYLHYEVAELVGQDVNNNATTSG